MNDVAHAHVSSGGALRARAEEVGRAFRAWEEERGGGPWGLHRRDHEAREIVDGNAAALDVLSLKDRPSLGEVRNSMVRLIEMHMTLGRGYPQILDPLWRIVRRIAKAEKRAVRILDIGAGQGAVLRRLHKRGRRAGIGLKLTAGDLNPGYVRLQNERFAKEKLPVRAVVADATDLGEFEDGSFDLAMHSFMLHHLAPEQVAASLLEMDRVARFGVYVFDLDRSRAAYAGMTAVSLLTPHKHRRAFLKDSTTSVRRAYTPKEVRWFLERFGLADGYRIARALTPPWRSIVWRLEPRPRRSGGR